jgi:hypothetical protein
VPPLPSPNHPWWVGVPPLPWGVYYVEVDGAWEFTMLRRSDGQVTGCGNGGGLAHIVPPLEPGTSYVQISAYDMSIAGRVGPTSTYVGMAPGCAGSRPATRLVPRDTPKIGRTLQVTLFDLPVSTAVMALAWQRVTPLDLAFLGMPGCGWHTAIDGTAILTGQNGQARWSLPIPDVASLVGFRFYNQALVLDPAAGNGFGAVVSDAAEAVIGHP